MEMAAGERTLFNVDESHTDIAEQIERELREPNVDEVARAVSIMQYHLDKEARNRQVSMLAPEDLCPAQKRDLVRDLAMLLRG